MNSVDHYTLVWRMPTTPWTVSVVWVSGRSIKPLHRVRRADWSVARDAYRTIEVRIVTAPPPAAARPAEGGGMSVQLAMRPRFVVLWVPGSGGLGLLPVLFLLCGFHLFGLLLLLPFGLVFLAFLVAHGVTPFLA